MTLRRTPRAERPRILRKDRRGANPVTVGLLMLLAVALIGYFGFTKDWPFSRGFEFQAVFKTSNSIRLDSPVRIAGVNVGKVKKIDGQAGTNNAVITMEIKKDGLPIHKDARLKIRPRIFLEGNFFVDLQPGTPEAPRLSDGDTIPVTQTAGPVQIDQILTALQQDTRKSLQTTLVELGTALTAKPTAEQDASQEPVVRGLTAADALNSALTYGGPALESTAVVNEALRGLAADDLSSLVGGLARVGRKLSGSEESLVTLVQGFNTTMAAMAAEQASLRTAVGELGPTVKTAYTSLGSLNAALPSVREFSLAVIPGVEETPATIAALTPWIGPTKALLSPDELGGLVADLRPATANLASAGASGVGLLRQGDLLARCIDRVILPAGNAVMPDGPLTTGKENYKEFWYAMVGLAGEAQNFDGNGNYVRFQTGGGAYPVALKGGNLQNNLTMYGNSAGKPLGTKPKWYGVTARPPYVFNKACYTQALPEFSKTATGPSDAQTP
ncbi:unannotated protein [freshwater metagenome]|uniref:Unannotated protein n=1 Tax=freshwater metagenome TaxID=449393 RepID=A0A6J7IZ51_9ZZZZ